MATAHSDLRLLRRVLVLVVLWAVAGFTLLTLFSAEGWDPSCSERTLLQCLL